MDAAFFALTRDPFERNPGVDEACLPPPYADLVRDLVSGLQFPRTISFVVGQAGAGKTTIVSVLAATIGRDAAVARLTARRQDLSAFLREALGQLDPRLAPEAAGAEMETLARSTASRRENGVPTVLLVDDGHELGSEVIDELRRSSPAHLILFGRPALLESLGGSLTSGDPTDPIRLQTMPTLTRDQALDYVADRIVAAGGRANALFAPPALDRIVTAAGGLMTRLEELSDKALQEAQRAGRPEVSLEIVERALTRTAFEQEEPTITEYPVFEQEAPPDPRPEAPTDAAPDEPVDAPLERVPDTLPDVSAEPTPDTIPDGPSDPTSEVDPDEPAWLGLELEATDSVDLGGSPVEAPEEPVLSEAPAAPEGTEPPPGPPGGRERRGKKKKQEQFPPPPAPKGAGSPASRSRWWLASFTLLLIVTVAWLGWSRRDRPSGSADSGALPVWVANDSVGVEPRGTEALSDVLVRDATDAVPLHPDEIGVGTQVDATPQRAGWVVQVGAFRSRSNAEGLVAKLQEIDPGATMRARGDLHLVASRPFPTQAEANAFASRIQAEGYSTVVRRWAAGR